MSSTKPKKHRRSAWSLPPIGATFVFDADGSVWRVKNIYPFDRQAHLVDALGSHHRFVHAADLERDYTEVPSS